MVLFVLVSVVAKTFEAGRPWLAYLAAFSEAAIIGALADWYAVVVLFRHPLGLRLPHTAIIPANQARIAENLGAFIATHFLVGVRVAGKVLEIDVAARFGRWIADDGNRRFVASHAARMMPQALEAMDDRAVHGALERGVLERLASFDMARLAGDSLELLTRGRRHHVILDEVLARVGALLADPAAVAAIREKVRAELPTLFNLFRADAFVVERLLKAANAMLLQVRADPEHALRAEFDVFVADFIGKLKDSPEYREKAEGIKQELLERAGIRGFVAQGWDRFVAWVRSDVEGEHRVVRPGFEAFLLDLGERLRSDAALRARLNQWIAREAESLTERYKAEVAGFVAEQVRAWDTRHMVSTIELAIGRDLQYIRINGTLVGGTLGLLIYGLTELTRS